MLSFPFLSLPPPFYPSPSFISLFPLYLTSPPPLISSPLPLILFLPLLSSYFPSSPPFPLSPSSRLFLSSHRFLSFPYQPGSMFVGETSPCEGWSDDIGQLHSALQHPAIIRRRDLHWSRRLQRHVEQRPRLEESLLQIHWATPRRSSGKLNLISNRPVLEHGHWRLSR